MSHLYRPPESCQIPGLAEIYERYFGARAHGWFVEVGGYDGDSYSNTSFLADLGWCGVYVEPVPGFAQACRFRHQQNRVLVVPWAAGGKLTREITLEVAGALTTAHLPTAAAHAANPGSAKYIEQQQRCSLTVKTRELDEILADVWQSGWREWNALRELDLLVVDVEGMEPEVFDGFTISKWRPRMMIVELHQDNPEFAECAISAQHLRNKIILNGYQDIFVDHVNTIFVRDR